MSKIYNVRPSEFIGIKDDYTRYCFDEAVAYIISKMNNGENPSFSIRGDNGAIERPHYSKMSELYKSMGYSQGQYKKQNVD